MTADLDPIGQVQDAILQRLAEAFTPDGGGASMLKKIDGLEKPFDGETSKTFSVIPPAVYVAPLKISPDRSPGTWHVSWAVYAVADRATTRTRTRGGAAPFGLGVYAIAATAARALQDWRPDLDCAGVLTFRGAENLTGWTLIAQKLGVWAVTLTSTISPGLINPAPEGGQGVGDFRHFWADIDLPPYQPAPDDPLPAARDAAINLELEE